jgi:hypothetical protein
MTALAGMLRRTFAFVATVVVTCLFGKGVSDGRTWLICDLLDGILAGIGRLSP